MEEFHSCSCCLVRPPEKGLRTLYRHLGKTEIYYDMLKDCFDINAAHLDGEGQTEEQGELLMGIEECGICEVCVGRLRDASEFKSQVQRSQAKLQAWLKGVITASDKFKIKLERATGDDNIMCDKFKIKLERATGDDNIMSGDIKLEKSEVEMADGEIVSDESKPEASELSTSIENQEVLLKIDLISDDVIDIKREVSLSPLTELENLSAETISPSDERKPDADGSQKHADSDDEAYLELEHDYETTADNSDKIFPSKLTTNVEYTKTAEQPECGICKKKFSSSSCLSRHKAVHMTEKPFTCDVCDKSFKFKDVMQRHKLTHNKKKLYHCTYCKKTFAHDSLLRKHELFHKKIECGICNKTFSSSSCLSRHKAVHKTEKPFTCDVCDKSFKLKDVMQRHKLTHIENKLYHCTYCKKTFSCDLFLKKHELLHKKNICCDMCGKQFSSMPRLIHHQRTHTGEKPYTCDVCKKRFAMKPVLKLHMRTHTGDQPYSCQICERKFTDPSSFRRHKRIHNEDRSSYPCEICNKEFRYKHSLEKHRLANCT